MMKIPDATTRTRQLAAITLLAALGFAGTFFPIRAPFGVTFIFGSIFSIIALRIFGLTAGLTVALAASLYTLQSWGHPYIILISLAEILCLGVFLRRGRTNLLLLDSMFWLCAGIPLTFLLYGTMMGSPHLIVALIAVKQAINGVFNALAASAFLAFYPMMRPRAQESGPGRTTFGDIIFLSAAAAMIIPTMMIILSLNERTVAAEHQRAQTMLLEGVRDVEDDIGFWFDRQLSVVREISHLGGRIGFAPSPVLQSELKRLKEMSGDLHNVYLADASGTTVGFFPERNELGESTIGLDFSDRPYFRQLQETLQPVVSNLFMGRGGVFKPIFTISVPFIHNGRLTGFSLGAVNIDQMNRLVTARAERTHLTVTVVDAGGAVVTSSDPQIRPLSRFALPEEQGDVEAVNDRISLLKPRSSARQTILALWHDSSYVTSLPLGISGWRVYATYPLASLQESLYRQSLQAMLFIALFLAFAMALSRYLARFNTMKINQLITLTRGLPERLEQGEAVTWPTSFIHEMDQLIGNVKEVAQALADRFAAFRQEQRTLEDRVAERTEFYRQVFEVNTAIKLIIDPGDGRIIDANQTAADFYGYTRDRLKNMTVTDINIAPPEVVAEQMRRVRTHDRQHFNFTHRCASGELREVEVYSGPVTIGGRVVLYSIIHDITERKQHEQEIRRYREIVQCSDDAIIAKDLKGIVTNWNKGAEVVFGYPAEEMVGRPIAVIYPPDLIPEEQTLLVRVISGEPAQRYISRRIRRDGAVIHVSVTLSPIRNEQGEIAGISKIARDITEEVRREEELARARDAADAANRAKSLFLANMSHEIRTPLNGVLGLAQLLEDEPLTPHQKEMVSRLRDTGDTLLVIINDILDFSRIEAGQLRFETREFLLSQILDGLDALQGRLARAKGLVFRIETAVKPDLRLVGDPVRFEQIILNLVNNAVKFTGQGEVSIRISSHPAAAGDIRLRVEVCDTGIGIPPEARDALFSPFTQADDSITRRFGGSGLGLSICKRLIEALGGEIGVVSTPGAGSTFWFELDFATATVHTAALPAGEHAPLTRQLHGRRILVVDDSAVNRDVVVRALDKQGIETVQAGNGREALTMIDAHPGRFDLVLMDIQMPELDGIAATRCLRQELKLATLPVIAFTAGVYDEDRQSALAAGVNDFLPKPVDLKQMFAMLMKWLPQGETGGDAAREAGRPQQAGEAAEGLPVIAGIDYGIVTGLYEDDRAFFLEMLGSFTTQWGVNAGGLREVFARGAMDEAARILHNLRGSAGNVGAMDIVQSALALEQAARTGSGDIPRLLAILESALSDLERATAAAVATAGGNDLPGIPTGPERLGALRDALVNRKAAAVAIFREMEPELAAFFGAESVSRLDDAIMGLRFAEALDTIEQAAVMCRSTEDGDTP